MEKTILKIGLVFCCVALVAVGALLVTAVTQEENEPTPIIVQPKTAGQISEDQAVAAASALGEGTLYDVEMEFVNGNVVYEVEFVDGYTETEVTVDAYTGAILATETETTDEEDEIEEALDVEELAQVTTQITEERAREIAVLALGGGTTADVEVEKEKGVYVYEVEVRMGGDEYDVLIDMQTGLVLQIEEDD